MIRGGKKRKGSRATGRGRGCGAEPRAEDGLREAERQIHVEPEKVGTNFCLHFILFSSREVLHV
jgi:hypothetical protein